jgi:hypothetical protein
MSSRTATFGFMAFMGAVLCGCGGSVPALPLPLDASVEASLDDDASGLGVPVVGRPFPDVSRGRDGAAPDSSAADAAGGRPTPPPADATRPATGADASVDAADARAADAEPGEHVDARKPGPEEAGVDAATTCRAGDPGCNSQHECDTASDCDDGDICCYDFSSFPASTRCRNDCSGGGGTRLQACRTQDECSSGTCSVHACVGQPAIESCQPRAPECP